MCQHHQATFRSPRFLSPPTSLTDDNQSHVDLIGSAKTPSNDSQQAKIVTNVLASFMLPIEFGNDEQTTLLGDFTIPI